MPDCPHFHLVFSLPAELWEFFKSNYRIAAGEFFAAAAETCKTFQKNNWGCEVGGFLAVLHTWGSRLNWHPHLHVLVSAGGVTSEGRWKEAREDYSFPVKSMSKVFGAIFLRRLEALDDDPRVQWPEGLESVEQKRQWRVMLSGRFWNIFSKATLGNTRAVVRYLARYTSRIAMHNKRLTGVDPATRQVSFHWKDYRDGAKRKEVTLEGGEFVRRFVQHLVPKGFRRIRYYGFATTPGAGHRQRALGAPSRTLLEAPAVTQRPSCPHCGHDQWRYTHFFKKPGVPRPSPSTAQSFSLPSPRAGPQSEI